MRRATAWVTFVTATDVDATFMRVTPSVINNSTTAHRDHLRFHCKFAFSPDAISSRLLREGVDQLSEVPQPGHSGGPVDDLMWGALPHLSEGHIF